MISEMSLQMRGRINCLTVRCPGCQQVWLAPGLAGGDEHACKHCGAVFVHTETAAPREPRDLLRPPPPPGAAESPT